MTDKELIKQYVERQKSQAHTIASLGINSLSGYQLACDNIIDFINSLPEEPASEDLKEAANKWNSRAYFSPRFMKLDSNGNPNGVGSIITTHADSFKAGAEWQKQQMKEAMQTEYEKGRFDMREEMMKDALDGCVSLIVKSDTSSRNLFISTPQLYKELQKYNDGDKVKIIICKSEQQ